MMKMRMEKHVAMKAMSISAVINLGMILLGFSGGINGNRTFLTRISDLIAVPPGVIINAIVSQKQHTVSGFFLSAVESLAISFLFYTLIALALLMLVYSIRRSLRNQDQSES
jgi:hypothetical protein